MKVRVISRRQFLKLSAGAAAALGFAQLPFSRQLLAASKKPAVVWLEMQDCAGCSESVLSCLTPDLRSVLLDTVTFRYHETIMAGTGAVAESALNAAITEGNYVLVLEGSIPKTDPRYCQVAGVAVEDTFVRAATPAAAILAVGACAAFGGIPKLGVTQGQSVETVMTAHSLTKTLYNVPGCPVHPTWFFDTVLDFLSGTAIPVDAYKRPTKHFGATVHSQCPRRSAYEETERVSASLIDWNDSSQRQWCMKPKGCRGPSTYSDCPQIKWNDGVNWCVGSNAPCSGCTEPTFCNDGKGGLYEPQPGN